MVTGGKAEHVVPMLVIVKAGACASCQGLKAYGNQLRGRLGESAVNEQ